MEDLNIIEYIPEHQAKKIIELLFNVKIKYIVNKSTNYLSFVYETEEGKQYEIDFSCLISKFLIKL